MKEQRDERLCALTRTFEAAPGLPEFECEAGPESASYMGSNGEGGAIPDNDPNGFESVINVAAESAFTVQSLQVRITVTHTWRGDLRIELTSPAGETALVHEFESSDSDDGFSEVFAVPDFAGDAALGNWTLRVIDRAGQDTGEVVGWTMGINADAP